MFVIVDGFFFVFGMVVLLGEVEAGIVIFGLGIWVLVLLWFEVVESAQF